METEVVMHRTLFDQSIRQKTKNEFLNANDLLLAGNRFRALNMMPAFSFDSWKASKGTKEFIAELELQFGKCIETTRGANGGTWMHPYLFIDLALAIDPKLKIEVYKWLHDSLLKNRSISGDSFKLMCGSLFERTLSKSTFARDISKLSLMIKKECGVFDWQHATEAQLAKRDKIHNNIALLANVMNNNREAIRLGILEANKQF